MCSSMRAGFLKNPSRQAILLRGSYQRSDLPCTGAECATASGATGSTVGARFFWFEDPGLGEAIGV